MSRELSPRAQSRLPGRGSAVLEDRSHAGSHVVKCRVVERWSYARAGHAHHEATDANPEGHDQASEQAHHCPLEETHHISFLAQGHRLVK